MGNDKERIRKWRERKRAEGKKSFTVVLSMEAQKVLLSEKDKTGSSYSAVIEKALLNLKKPNYKLPKARYMSAEVFEKKVTGNVTSNDKYFNKIPIIIDDLANYPKSKELTEHLGHDKGTYRHNLKSGESFISRILRSSRNKLSRKKK